MVRGNRRRTLAWVVAGLLGLTIALYNPRSTVAFPEEPSAAYRSDVQVSTVTHNVREQQPSTADTSTADNRQPKQDKEHKAEDTGRSLYEAGRYAEAIQLWQRQLRLFTAQGDRRNQALTLSRLALAYGQLGQWQQANQAIAASLALVQTPGIASPELTQGQVLTIQGHLLLQQGDAEAALTTWQQARTAYQTVGARRQVLQTEINQANAMRAMGLYNRARSTLDTTVNSLLPEPDSSLKAAGLLHLGNALRLLQLLEDSERILEASLRVAERIGSEGDRQLALLHLGNTARANNNVTTALAYYRQVSCPPTPSTSTMSNSAVDASAGGSSSPSDAAIRDAIYYDEVPDDDGKAEPVQPSIGTCTVKLQATLNQLRLLVDTQQLSAATPLLSILQTQLATLPISEFAIYAQINFAESLLRYWSLSSSQPQPPAKELALAAGDLTQERYRLTNVPTAQIQDIAQRLAAAVQQARQIQNPKAESYALGNLAGLYEATQQWQDALSLTQQALLLAQGLNSPGITYQWHWQLGRVLTALGDRQQAIAAYTSAVRALDDIRSDLVNIDPNLQLSFKERVEPVYRNLMELLLPVQQTSGHATQADGTSEPVAQPAQSLDKAAEQENLRTVRDLIESLQLAELENYFRTACLDSRPQLVEAIDPNAAVLYPILLDDRLEVLLSVPQSANPANPVGQVIYRNTVQKPRRDIEATIAAMRLSLRRNSFLSERLPPAKTIYNWLIKPFEAQLSGIDTIVFLLDGGFRNIPMAALHGDRHYLIEDYRIALTPSLRLLQPRPLNTGGLRILKAGISQSVQGFVPLPGVKTEIAQIAANLPGVTLLNQEFTLERFQQQLRSTLFPIIHLATHGQFSSNPNETFILSWNEPINLSKLEKILKTVEYRSTPIELLILSACQTAAGDDRASLGLAGMAIRSGARSTLATLWAVEDQSTASLMIEFYRLVTQPGITRAEALRLAQLELLRGGYEHPYFWAPFVLIGNWL